MAGLDGCGKLDISEMSYDNIVVIGNKVWVKAEVEEKIWIYDNAPCAVIKLGEACYARVCDDLDPIPRGLFAAANFLQLFMDCPGNAAGGGGGGDPPPCEGCSEDPASDCYTPGGCPPEEPLPPEEEQQPQAGASLGNGNSRKARSVDSSLDKQEIEPAKNNVDIRAINALGWKGMAVIPSAGIIPMKSNTTTYGPYASSNFGNSCGGTQVEVNTDLAPWVFGSSGAMNAAGQTLVESSAIGLNKAETGAITIPGLPVDQFTKLGSVLGSGGATLSSMNFSYGASGISTNYEFRTYTPKFGGLSRHLIDRIKDISRNRTEALRFFRNQEIMINKAGRQRAIFNQKLANRDGIPNRGPNDRPSLQRLFIGTLYDWQGDGQRTVLGTDKLLDSSSEMVHGFDTKAYASWDLFYGPISKYGDGGLPRFAAYETGCHLASSDLPIPPYAKDEYPTDPNNDPFTNGLDQNNVDINRDFLDPLTNNFEDGDHHHDGEGRGHVIDIVGRGDSVPNNGMITNFYHLDDENRYDDDYRFFGMRGPLVLHSWGYDTQGKPIPNEADIDGDTKEGKFTNEHLKDSFLKDWLAKPATWPVAPIDFRFDRKRGVWVTPPGYKVVVAILEEKLEAYGTATASLINKDTSNGLEFGSTLYDKDGEEVKATDEEDTEAKIKIVDRIGKTYGSGTKVYAYYDTYRCEYIILEAKTKNSIRFRLIDICENTPVEPDYGDVWTKYAGYGDKFPNNHILGIRINCEGDPIDNKGNFINHNDIADQAKRKDIFINLYDTCGTFGGANAYYDANGGEVAFRRWKDEAATGFALLCDPPAGDGTCDLGEPNEQCSTVNPDYDSYDIVFLDGYARFVECELTQKLYMTEDEAWELYPEDDFKTTFPSANATATILQFYGDPGNGIEPKFYKTNGGGLEQTDFRVFDPFEGYPPGRNPFAKLTAGDKVLAVFDENRKKYIIYNALKDDEKVIKFALIDNKDIGDRISRAVLVDIEGYPIDEFGIRLNEDNFVNNFITVFDSFAIHGYTEPVPKYHNWGTTGFGPALGSDDFNEHMNGIILNGGDQTPPSLPGGDSTSVWTGGPFIGFAIRRKMPSNVTDELAQYVYDHEIFFLESFAQMVEGKIASQYATVGTQYYLGTRRVNPDGTGGFINGRIPITRDPIEVDARANLRVRFPLDQHYAGKYIAGDFWDQYQDGKAYQCTDGCKFIAQLDHVNSKVNDGGIEKLYYTIIEVENVANRVKTVLTKKERSDELNAGEVKEKSEPSEGIISQYMDGWIWDKTPGISKSKYEKITIFNRQDWSGKALIIQWKDTGDLHIHSNLTGYDAGTVYYQVSHAGTIAEVGEATVPLSIAGTFGFPNGVMNPNDKRIGKFDSPLFYQGLDPLSPSAELQEADQPTIDVSNPWMTYEGAGIISLWNERASDKIENAQYRVVYAREAPIIITGIAYEDFQPFKADNIVVDIDSTVYSSCPGYNKKPVTDLVIKAKNPMGFGALQGDLVTLQRVNINTITDNANYYYIIIGTGKLVGAN